MAKIVDTNKGKFKENLEMFSGRKKVTLTFIVSNDVADNAVNELGWGEMGNAADILNAACEESDYNIEDV